jgi:hypothetical protein
VLPDPFGLAWASAGSMVTLSGFDSRQFFAGPCKQIMPLSSPLKESQNVNTVVDGEPSTLVLANRSWIVADVCDPLIDTPLDIGQHEGGNCEQWVLITRRARGRSNWAAPISVTITCLVKSITPEQCSQKGALSEIPPRLFPAAA